jgi:GT2 family glycosyltransferase
MAVDPLCDIVLLVWNHLELTQPCVESLLRCTEIPARLLIVDNDSSAETKAYLRSIRSTRWVTVKVLTNARNEGYVGGMNRGLRHSTAPFVCLLNNDTLLTPEWLSRMIRAANRHADIGLVNPASNTFGERPPDGMTIDAYAGLIANQRGRLVEVGQCIGFCLLIKRAVIETIGILDETLDRFFFEDTEYGLRAARAGFRSAVAREAYVWHAEHRSVRMLPPSEREAIFAANRRRCWARWGKPLRVALVVDPEMSPGEPRFRPALEQAVALARRNGFVYLIYRDPDRLPPERLFERHHLMPHANVSCLPYPRRLGYGAWAAYRILRRVKKPFDLVVAPSERWARRLGTVGGLVGAEAVRAADGERLEEAWRRRSRYLLL